MQNATWLSFCVSNSVTRASVHFFPNSDNVTAPYPANCAITLFGGGVDSRSVVLEGGRLSNPDGLRLDDAFPELKADASGMFGLAVELTSPQQSRLNMAGSGCVIELSSHGYCCRFRPARLLEQPSEQEKARIRRQAKEGVSSSSASCRCPSKTGIALKDVAHTTSLVVVNGSEYRVRAVDHRKSVQSESVMPQPKKAIGEVLPQSVFEFPFGDEFFEGGLEQECSWGKLKSQALNLSLEVVRESEEVFGGEPVLLGASVAAYVVYRDANSRRIVSVDAL